MIRPIYWRWGFFIVGIILLGLGIAMTIKGAVLGIGPWDVLHVGLYKNFGMSVGFWAIMTGLLIVLTTALYSKQWPLIGTWLNMLLIGLFIDFFLWLLPNVSTLFSQTVLFIAGIAVISVGVGMYIASNIGAGPRDSLMLILIEKTGWSVKRVRTLLEVVVGVVGWMLGGPIGIGTIFIALTLGYLVHYTLSYSRAVLAKLSALPE